MAHGYKDGEKFRGGDREKRMTRNDPKLSKTQTSRKMHDTKQNSQRPSKAPKIK